jgi:hypothetical protein
MAARRMGGHGRSPNGGTWPLAEWGDMAAWRKDDQPATALRVPALNSYATRRRVSSSPSYPEGLIDARVMSSRVKSPSSIPHRFSAMNLMQQRSVTSLELD